MSSLVLIIKNKSLSRATPLRRQDPQLNILVRWRRKTAM